MRTSEQQTGSSNAEFRLCEDHGLRAILFDWDGVLVDSGANYYRAYELVLRDAGITTTPREIYLREGQPTGQLLRAILNEHGRASDPAQIQEMVEQRRSYDIALGERRFFEGIWTLIGRLRKADFRIGMVTGSSRKSVERVLTSDLASNFDVVITADDVSRSKPDPEPFVRAAEKLCVQASECLVVENAPFGIRAARSAGCEAVGLCTTLAPEDLCEASWIALDHQELETLLCTGRAQPKSGGRE
jgi:beta-phosphoglucomutase